ncbi:MAG: hypothetical protein IKU07_07795 [Oscillospiraceae bacterium]|nr:hypothetical protein [Oscillospiraceae bacterium]
MENQKTKIEIDLLDLLFFLKKKILYLVAACILFAIAGACATHFFMEDEYTAKTRMYVLSRSSDTELSSSDYNIANFMIKDYQVLITGENVTRKVIEELQLPMTVGQLASKISVSAIDNTRVLQIVVVDTQPQRAADIANCVREVSSAQIKAIMDVDAVNLVYEAEVPSHKSGPSMPRNATIAAVLGFALMLLVLVIIYTVDDTIRTDEDVTRHLGLSTLGVIPVSKELESMGMSGTLRKRKKALNIGKLFRRK